MDEISKINIFGHTAVSKTNDENMKKQNSKPEDKGDVKEKNSDGSAKISSETVLDALNMQAIANKAQMGVKSINPRDYLSEERIKDIEDSMGVFEKGVEEHAAIIKQEFGALQLSEAAVNELAAQSFSLQV